MALDPQFVGGTGLGGGTQNAGTVIQFLAPPRSGAYTRLTTVTYVAGSTAHTVTYMRPIGKTTTSAAAAASQAVINLTADPGPSGNGIAANDFLAWQNSDGTFSFDKVSSVASLAITMTNSLSKAVSSGAPVWDFGITSDTDPRTGVAHPAYVTTASAANTQTDSVGGVVAALAPFEPILLNSDNASNAGKFTQITVAYSLL